MRIKAFIKQILKGNTFCSVEISSRNEKPIYNLLILKKWKNQLVVIKEVANALDIGYSNYNKIENGNREISVKELQRLAEFYNITVDQVINLNDGLPKEVVIEDKQAQEQLRLISELDTDDRAIIFKMIDKMLTSKKFKDFFSKNVASL